MPLSGTEARGAVADSHLYLELSQMVDVQDHSSSCSQMCPEGPSTVFAAMHERVLLSYVDHFGQASAPRPRIFMQTFELESLSKLLGEHQLCHQEQ